MYSMASRFCWWFVIGQLGIGCSQLLPDSFQLWTQELSLETGMEVKWNSDDPYYLTLEMSAPTLGYVAIGFSPSGGMKGSDIVLGWVDRDGIPYLVDFYAPEREQPLQDEQQDYNLVAASERNGRTTVRFRRRWDTCDERQDLKIDGDTVRLIWAWHPSDPVTIPSIHFHWHGALTRGSLTILLHSPPNQIKFPDKFYSSEENIQQWDVTMSRVHIEPRETTHMCRIFKFPRPDRKYHLVGFRPLILKPENTEFVHHITLYSCHVPYHYGGTKFMFEKYVGNEAAQCFGREMPPDWGTHCMNFLFTWALGSEGEMFPNHIGIPIGESDDSQYFKLEVHYNNPMRKTFMDSSGLRVFYTGNLRANDAGTIFLGHRITPFQMIPHFQDSFTTHSFCSKECTRNGISSPEGMKITSGLLHAHSAGRKIMLRHIRSGVELPPILQDKNYDINFQQFQRVKDEVIVLPGDELIVECSYDTERKSRIIFGGLSTEEEMCQAIVFYYPKTDLTDCRSQPEFYSFFTALGISNVTGAIFDKMSLPLSKYQPYVTVGSVEITQVDNAFQLAGTMEDNFENPFEMSRLTTPAPGNYSVGTYLRQMNWRNKELVNGIETAWRDGLHYMFCSSSGLRRIQIEETTTKFPKFTPFTQQQKSDCRNDAEASQRSSTSSTHPVTALLTTLLIALRHFS